MSRYINQDNLIDAIKMAFEDEEDGYQIMHGSYWNAEMVVSFIKDFPAVDAVPVVHGHWIKIGSQDSIRNMKCSICGEEVFGDVDTEKYCFNCGAKMDEVTE